MGEIVGGMTRAAGPRPAARSVFASYRGLLLGLLLLAGVLNYMDRQIIAVLKPMLQAELGWDDKIYGHLVSLFQFAAAVAFLFAGWFVDRVGWRRANPLGVGAWSLAAMAHGFAQTVGQFSAVRVALGATEAVGTPAAIKTVAVWFRPEERSVALGAVNAATNLGAIITPLAVPAMALALGWRTTFMIVGGIGLLWVVCWWLLMSSDRLGDPPNQTSAAPQGQPVPWRIILTDRRTWAVAGAKALTDQVWWFLLFWMPDLFLRVFHLDMRSFGVPLATIYATAAVGSLLGGYVSGRLLAGGMSLNRARKMSLLVCALLVLPVPLVMQVDNHWQAVALLALTLAAHQGFSVNLFALITDVVPASRVGSVTSVGALCGNIAGMLVLQAAGWVLASGGSYAPFFFLAASSYLLALLWIHLLLPTLKPVEATGAGD